MNQQSLFALHHNRAQLNKAAPKVWKDDNFVSQKLNELEVTTPSVRVLWSTGMNGEATALSDDDLSVLNYLMHSDDVSTIVIPQNTGGHWYPVILQKEGDNWNSYQLTTRMDGLCGDDLVEQTKLFVKKGAAQYQLDNFNKVNSVEPSLQQQIEKACQLSLQTISGFDYELARLAQLELKESHPETEAQINAAVIKLQDLFNNMGAEEQDARQETLEKSGLTEKLSIQAILSR